jgi:uncharacterized protein with NAD-binding domain and iron-sulfur cluster
VNCGTTEDLDVNLGSVVETRPRVVVIGGGMAGLTAAWRLSDGDWRARFSEITVIERSHRLGGKGASSRGVHGRIEEHGLHVWLGHYDNAFRLIRDCYAELDRERTAPSCPVRTWRDAFFPAGDLGLFDLDGSIWTPWVASFSGNARLPGDPDAGGTLYGPELVLRAAVLLRDFYSSLRFGADGPGTVTLAATPAPPRPRGGGVQGLAATVLAVSNQLLLLASEGAGRLTGRPGGEAINAAFGPLLARLAPLIATDPRARRFNALTDLIRGVLKGVLADRLIGRRDTYRAIHHLEFRDWLRKHGVQPDTLSSALIRGQYDLAFSPELGDPSRSRIAADWGVFLATKLWFDYKGAIFWKMRGGMGDVVFAPLYEALKARGVRFRFLTRAEELVPDATGHGIDSLVLRSTHYRDGQDYQPLIQVKDLPCFPVDPDARQIDGQTVEELRRGRDFEHVVLAVPPAAAREASARLAEQHPEWRRMLDGIGAVATHAFQVWLGPDERELGWPHPGTTMSAFAKPFDTWASMSHVLDLEAWDAGGPRTVGYFCSTLPAEAGTGTDAAEYTRQEAVQFLRRYSPLFWPGASDPQRRDFRWDLLRGDTDANGPQRFDSQYWTANTDPSDRYVQALPGTDEHRLTPAGSGYQNLALAGDWTDCGLNAGCIESAVLSGLQAGNALLGRPRWDHVIGTQLR